MLFKKKIFQNLTKIFFVEREASFLSFDRMKATVFKYCKNTPSKYAINWGADIPISKFSGSIDISRLNYLEVLDASGQQLFTILKTSFEETKKPIFQFTLIRDFDPSFAGEGDMIANLEHEFTLVYGYSRSLREDFVPSSETRLKKGFFSSEVKNEEPNVWMFNQREMVDGGVKGIYPLNYWNANALNRLKDIGVDFSFVQPLNRNIYLISEELIDKLGQGGSKYKKYFRFDGLGT